MKTIFQPFFLKGLLVGAVFVIAVILGERNQPDDFICHVLDDLQCNL